MSVVVPVPVGGTAAGWSLVDFRSYRASTPAAAGGLASLQLPQLDPTELWIIDHAVVSCTSSTPTSVRWYADTATPAQLLDGSNAGNFDVADWPAGLQLAPGTGLLVVWSGASNGAIGSLALQARVLRRP